MSSDAGSVGNELDEQQKEILRKKKELEDSLSLPPTTDVATPSVVSQDSTEASDEKAEDKSDANTFDIYRPQLTMEQAAALLGKSVRALERSLAGRWGNKLPEGWNARKVKTESGEEWRIIPPAGFKIKSTRQETEKAIQEILSFDPAKTTASSFEILDFNPNSKRGAETPTIVIDRSEDVELLLRELLSVQKSLSEERRLHMEDLRMMTQLQSSMRLIESTAAENATAKSDLEATKQELESLKRDYDRLSNLPWWKRIFAFAK